MLWNIDEWVVLDLQPLEEVRILLITRTGEPRISTTIRIVWTTICEDTSVNNHMLNKLTVRTLESDKSTGKTTELTVGDWKLSEWEWQTLWVHIDEVVRTDVALRITTCSILVHIVIVLMRMEVDLIEPDRLDGQRYTVLSTACRITAEHNGDVVGRISIRIWSTYTEQYGSTSLASCEISRIGLQSESLCHVEAGCEIIGLSTFQIVNLSLSDGVILHVIDEDGINTGRITQQILGIVNRIRQNGVVWIWGELDLDWVSLVTLHTYHGTVELAVVITSYLTVRTINDIGSVRLQSVEIHITIFQICRSNVVR